MTPLRISATTLDSFRLLKQAEWYTWERFYQELMGFREETPEMRVGTAFHKIMENPERYESEMELDYPYVERYHQCDGINFELMSIAIEHREERAVTEVKLIAPFRVRDYDIDLVCKVDAAYGKTLWDYKTRFRPFDGAKIEDLIQSLQWKAYCHAFGARRFVYVVAHLEQEHEGVIRVVACDTMELFAYPGIESELRRELAEFVELLDERYLLPYFQPKGGDGILI